MMVTTAIWRLIASEFTGAIVLAQKCHIWQTWLQLLKHCLTKTEKSVQSLISYQNFKKYIISYLLVLPYSFGSFNVLFIKNVLHFNVFLIVTFLISFLIFLVTFFFCKNKSRARKYYLWIVKFTNIIKRKLITNGTIETSI